MSDIEGVRSTDSENEEDDVALTPKKRRADRGGDLARREKPKHRDQKFRQEWLQEEQYKLWLRPSEDHFRAKCTVCQKDFRAELSVIKRHMAGQKHLERISNSTPKSRGIMNVFKAGSTKEQVLIQNAEIKLSAFAAAHNISFLTMDHLSSLMQECFPDSEIAKQIKLKRTKTKNIIVNVIGDNEKSDIVQQLKTTKFSILIDESTDIGCVKTACVVVRYYSEEDGGIVSKFFELTQVFSASDAEGADQGATGERLFNLTVECFKRHNIPTENIVGFGSDNCNTMMGTNNSVASRLRDLCPNITILGCICHSIHLCASAACRELPRTPEDLARNIFAYFNASAKRQAQFAQFQQFLELDVHRMLHPSQTRWLSLNAVVDRIVLQWDALRLYFDDQWLVHNLRNSEAIHIALRDPFIKGYFLFLSWILPKFTTMNIFFQSSKVVITNLHEKMTNAYKELLQTYLKRDYINSTPLADIDPSNEAAFLPLNLIYMGVAVLNLISKPEITADRSTLEYFQRNCRNFLMKACCEIRARYNFNDPVLASMKYLNPQVALDPSSRDTMPSLIGMMSLLPRCAPQEDAYLQNVDDEWRRLPNVANCLPDDIVKTTEPDKFWHKLLTNKDECGLLEFKKLPKFALAVLSLPHSNADTERQFSKINNIKTKCRNRLITPTINGVVLASQAVKKCKYCCVKFQPSREMRNRMSAKALYSKAEQTETAAAGPSESDEDVIAF